VAEFFFEASARRRQIRRVHQGDGVGLHALAMQQPAQQMLVDAPQPAHAHPLAELREHPRRWELPPQPGELSPSGLFGQLGHDQVEGAGGSQPRQQMGAPKLSGAQVMSSAPGESAWTQVGDKGIGHITGKQFEQGNGAHGRQRGGHARTLTEPAAADTPLESA